MHSKPYSALIHSCRTLLRRPCAPVLLSLALAVAGCTSASFDTADQRHEDALKRVGEARNALLQPQAAPAYAVEDQRPVIARRSIALSRDAALPDAFRLVTFRFPGRYTLPNGNEIYILAEGRLVNLATPKGMGHPIEVMDLSFALQALCTLHIAKNGRKMKGGVYEVPQEIDEEVANLKLSSLGLTIDSLSREQKKYGCSWDVGT